MSDKKKNEHKTLYVGNFGYPPYAIPPELPAHLCDWLDDSLKLKVKMGLNESWASNKLKILAQMLENKGEDHFAKELRGISEVFDRNSKEDVDNNTKAYKTYNEGF